MDRVYESEELKQIIVKRPRTVGGGTRPLIIYDGGDKIPLPHDEIIIVGVAGRAKSWCQPFL